jgi:hypothetical protein
MPNRDSLLALVQIGDLPIRKELHDRSIQTIQVPLLDRSADQVPITDLVTERVRCFKPAWNGA